MEWGIILAFPTVLGMLFLIFGGLGQTEAEVSSEAGHVPPAVAQPESERRELKKAA